jgi:hypothetical protein
MIGLILPFVKAPKKMVEKEGSRDKYFKGQQQNEELICFFRKHWLTALTHIGFMALFVLIEVIFFVNFSRIVGLIRGNSAIELLYVGVVILATVYMHKIFARMFGYFMNTVVFTNSRIIEHRKTLFLKDSHEVLDIMKIQDVRKSQDGIVKNLLKYGDLLVTLSSDQASKLFNYVPNVNFHFRCLSRAKRDAFLHGRIQRLRDEHAEGRISGEKAVELVNLEAEETEKHVQKVAGVLLEEIAENIAIKSVPNPIASPGNPLKSSKNTPVVPSYTDLLLSPEDRTSEDIVGSGVMR